MKKATNKKAIPKSSRAADTKGRAMVADLKELIATLKAGIPLETKYTVRTIELPDGPGHYGADDIRATRNKIGSSQAVFAYLMGVSVKLVQAWEQGNRAPAIWARRLFDEMNRDPRHWRAMLKKAS
jgi:putative transcriptional regulator